MAIKSMLIKAQIKFQKYICTFGKKNSKLKEKNPNDL
jgi:hypothetical protein